MKVLVACEFSGIVRDAFTARGHTAMSCDLLPSERPGVHYQGDVRDLDLSLFDLGGPSTSVHRAAVDRFIRSRHTSCRELCYD